MRVVPIERLDDPRVRDYRNVRDADLRGGSGLFMAEGRLNVERLLASERYRARSVFLTRAALRGLAAALESLSDDTPVYLAGQGLLNEVVGYAMHRGCLAAGVRPEEDRLDDVLARSARGARLLVVLEDVTNPDNVGGVFRNAMAFGADAVLLTSRCADPLYRKSIRVSMGGALRVPFARVADAGDALARLREADFAVLALSAGPEAIALADYAPAPPAPERVVLVLGNEGDGLSRPVLAAADASLAIPMVAGVDSLNVATASGIALHHVAVVLRARRGRVAAG
jgi:tRNA G18 (ribose-2'-O)-methylase SpoU